MTRRVPADVADRGRDLRRRRHHVIKAFGYRRDRTEAVAIRRPITVCCHAAAGPSRTGRKQTAAEAAASVAADGGRRVRGEAMAHGSTLRCSSAPEAYGRGGQASPQPTSRACR